MTRTIIKATHEDYGTWYFTNLKRASIGTKVHFMTVQLRVFDGKQTHGWTFYDYAQGDPKDFPIIDTKFLDQDSKYIYAEK